MTDSEWAAASGSSPLPADVWMPSVQVMLARQQAGSAAGLTVAAKGGHNAEHHNHNDVGSIVVAVDGIPVIVDAGRPTYTLQTFGPDRYDIWTMQSSWHCVPEIAGVAQGAGREFAARDVEYSTNPSLSLDLAGAYPVRGLTSWRREVRLDRAAHRVVIRDSWEAENLPATVHLLLAGQVSDLVDGALRILPLHSATPVWVRWTAGVAASLTVRELDDPMLTEVWGARLTRLELHADDRENLEVTVELDRATKDTR